jgi:hypothetical protein
MRQQAIACRAKRKPPPGSGWGIKRSGRCCPVQPQTLATSFEGRNTPARKQRISKVLENLVATGSLRMEGDGDSARYFAVK